MKIRALLVALVLLTACGPEVYFDQPQPAELPPLTEVPEVLWGIMDSTSLHDDRYGWLDIDEHTITYKRTEPMWLTKGDLQNHPRFKLLGDTSYAEYQLYSHLSKKFAYEYLIDREYYRENPIRVEKISGDTLFFRTYVITSVDVPCDSLQLKYFEGNYLLSYKKDNAKRWEVAVLYVSDKRDTLKILPVNSAHLTLLKKVGQVDSVATSMTPHYTATVKANGWKQLLSEISFDDAILFVATPIKTDTVTYFFDNSADTIR